MNLKEFGALKIGDKIDNPAAGGVGHGEVVECTTSGVRVVWGPRHDRETRFFYSVVGTAWMNWNKVQYPPRDCTSGPCTRDDCRRADQCLGGDYAKIAVGATK